MDGFDDRTGHLTAEGFAALLAGELDDLASLEVAEHLSFCDSCCARYAGLLTGEVLLEPERPLAPPVMERVKRHGRVIFFRRAMKVGLAACLALTLWFSGVFTLLPSAIGTAGPDRTAQRLEQEQRRNDAAEKELKEQLDTADAPEGTLNMRISNAIDQLFGALNQKGESDK